MKLSVKGMALSLGLVWGGAMLIVGISLLLLLAALWPATSVAVNTAPDPSNIHNRTHKVGAIYFGDCERCPGRYVSACDMQQLLLLLIMQM